MLQNRVDPFGNILKTAARGHWMGNRGVLHDADRNLLRNFKLKNWITCHLEFRGRKRAVMAPNRYTELFFLDEATSYAAGHRPCFECRRQEYEKFKSSWLQGNPEYGFNEKTSIQKIDDILHRERLGKDGAKPTFEESPDRIPNGCFVLFEEKAWMLYDGTLFMWTAEGYKEKKTLPLAKKLHVITLKSIVRAFRAGLERQVDASAFKL
jgi:hypothetical protein